MLLTIEVSDDCSVFQEKESTTPTTGNKAVSPPTAAAKPTSAPVVPVDLPEESCIKDADIELCITYHADLSCDMRVNGVSRTCCYYNPKMKFVSTFDCTNIGDEWGARGLCEPGPMPSVDDEDEGKDAEDDETDQGARTEFTELLSFNIDGSTAFRQRRGRRRAQAARRQAEVTKKRREAMTK